MDVKYLTRQLEIIPVKVLNEKITIIGAGAIGSFTALTLAKMGFENITVYDDDTIEDENINSQFFRLSDVGRRKVEALRDLIEDFTGVNISYFPSRYEGGKIKGIVISAVDSMEARRLIWEEHKDFSIGTRLVIDPRMGAEQALCYAMNPLSNKDIASYEKTLYSDEDAVQERCTAKSTVYCALSLSAHVVKVVKDFLCNDEKYTRVMEWSVKDNFQKCHANEVKK